MSDEILTPSWIADVRVGMEKYGTNCMDAKRLLDSHEALRALVERAASLNADLQTRLQAAQDNTRGGHGGAGKNRHALPVVRLPDLVHRRRWTPDMQRHRLQDAWP